MLLALLFLHLLAVAMLFAAAGIEIAAFYQLHRATTVSQVGAAVLSLPLVGPLMGGGAGLLIVAGVAMVYVGGFGWQPWVIIAAIVTLLLAVSGPVINGKRGEAICALAEKAPDGPITAEIGAARADRVLNYSIALTACELVAALYIMTNKPEPIPCIAAVIVAAIIAAIPTLRVVRTTS